jgi:small subunit ribosomal protein S20
MANHRSALKRIRSSRVAKIRNRYYAKTTRNLIKTLRNTTDKTEAQSLLISVSYKLDRLAKRNIIHKNKASNNKSKLTKFVNSL